MGLGVLLQMWCSMVAWFGAALAVLWSEVVCDDGWCACMMVMVARRGGNIAYVDGAAACADGAVPGAVMQYQ